MSKRHRPDSAARFRVCSSLCSNGSAGRAPAERSQDVVRGVVPKRALARIVFASGASLGRWCDRGWPYVDKTGLWRGLLPRSSLRSANPATLGARQPLSAVLDVPGRRAAGFQQARTRSSFALFPPVLSSFILLETGAIQRRRFHPPSRSIRVFCAVWRWYRQPPCRRRAIFAWPQAGRIESARGARRALMRPMFSSQPSRIACF